MMEPTREQIRAATLLRIKRACDAIQEAQNQLGTACSELSALMYGAPAWKKAAKLYDQVHAFWYVTDALQHNRKVTLDSVNVDGLRRALERAAAAGTARQAVSVDQSEGMGGDAVLDRCTP